MKNTTDYATFHECVWACWDNVAFMKEYRRLTGHKLNGTQRIVIEFMIDRETGYRPDPLDDKEARQFFEFVRDHIWLPLVFQHSVHRSTHPIGPGAVTQGDHDNG